MQHVASKDELGQAILEFAVILPLFVFIGFGLVDLQWCVAKSANLEYIVTETARCEAIAAAACTGSNTPGSYAHQLAVNVRMNLGSLTMVSSACNGSTCTVVMTYHFTPFGVWFPNVTIKRTGTAAQPPGAGG